MADKSLADQIIAAKEAETQMGRKKEDSAPDGYYTDDLGYWVERDIKSDRARFAEYVAFRCLKVGTIYKDRGVLYDKSNIIYASPGSVTRVANIPYMITQAQANWVYNKLMELAPELSKNLLYICKDTAWDMEKSELIDISDRSYSTTTGIKHIVEKE